MATLEHFHSFVKLVRLMHNTQQESYKAHNGNRNLIAKAKALETKVAAQLREYPTGQYKEFYEWQERFILLVKRVRSDQAMYYSTKYESVLRRCRESEDILGKSIAWIEYHHPAVFTEAAKQTTLEL